MKKLLLKEVGTQPQRLRPRAPEAGEVVIIGVDLSRTKWVYACRWGGHEQRRFGSPGELPHLQALVREYQQRGCEVHVVYEACGFGYQIAWWLEAHNAHVMVVAPSCVEKAPGAQVKTDGLDAGSLALKAERGLLKGIYIPTREQHEYRQLSRTYGQALKDRCRQQVRVRMLVQEHGSPPPAAGCGWGALERGVLAQPWPAPVCVCVTELVGLRTTASSSARRLAQELRAVGRLPQYAEVSNALAQQSGVGRCTAVRFILEVGDIHRFATADSLPNYLGLTPQEYSSGEMVHRGHVRKCGPGSVRAWLVQCAWAAVRTGKDTDLVECFRRLEPRVGRKRAIVAVARKLALRLRARWRAFELALKQAV
jgi:transposase